MIARYSRPEMSRIWEDRYRYLVWLKVELAVCEELAATKHIPRSDWKILKARVERLIEQGGVDPERVEYHEGISRHDVIAFTAAVAEKVGPTSRYIHFGLTSSDVIDTALSIMLRESGARIRADIQELLKVLRQLALRYKDLPTIGRSHGMFAEPTSFGLKFLAWHAEWTRNLARLDASLEGLRVGKLSGAVGVNAHWGPGFEKKVLKRLALRREPVATQVIPRDRHAEFVQVLALAGGSLERMAVELRHLQRSEVGEVLEGFRKGQKGSSAMPHKRNPISSENVTGCARLLRAYAGAALEDIALWHERDISHSSVERVALPDSTILLDYAIHRMSGILTNLVVREDRVRQNLAKAGDTVFSGHVLLALVRRGATREEAYRWVQECAIGSLEGRKNLVELLLDHPEVRRKLSAADIRKMGSLEYQLRNVGAIFKETLGRK